MCVALRFAIVSRRLHVYHIYQAGASMQFSVEVHQPQSKSQYYRRRQSEQGATTVDMVPPLNRLLGFVQGGAAFERAVQQAQDIGADFVFMAVSFHQEQRPAWLDEYFKPRAPVPAPTQDLHPPWFTRDRQPPYRPFSLMIPMSEARRLLGIPIPINLAPVHSVNKEDGKSMKLLVP